MGKHSAPGESDQDTELFCVAPACKREILPSEPHIQVSVTGLRGAMHRECLIAHNEAQRGADG